MNNIIQLVFIWVFAFSWSAFSSDHAKVAHPGEYYEFDTKDGAEKKMGHVAKEIVAAPYRGMRYVCRKSKSVTTSIINAIEQFLSDSRSVNGDRQKLKKNLDEWGADYAFENYYERENKDMESACCFGMPKASMTALKRILYTAGFTLPKATWRTIKNIGRGTKDCAGV